MKTGAGTRAVRPVSLNIVLHGKNHSSYTIYTVSTHMDTLIVHQGSGQYLDLRGRLQGSILSSALKRSPLRLRKSLISFSSLYRTLPHPPHPPLPPSTQSPQIFYSFSSCVVTPSWRYSIFSSLNQIQFLPLSPVCKPKSVNSSTVFFFLVFFQPNVFFFSAPDLIVCIQTDRKSAFGVCQIQMLSQSLDQSTASLNKNSFLSNQRVSVRVCVLLWVKDLLWKWHHNMDAKKTKSLQVKDIWRVCV